MKRTIFHIALGVFFFQAGFGATAFAGATPMSDPILQRIRAVASGESSVMPTLSELDPYLARLAKYAETAPATWKSRADIARVEAQFARDTIAVMKNVASATPKTTIQGLRENLQNSSASLNQIRGGASRLKELGDIASKITSNALRAVSPETRKAIADAANEASREALAIRRINSAPSTGPTVRVLSQIARQGGAIVPSVPSYLTQQLQQLVQGSRGLMSIEKLAYLEKRASDLLPEANKESSQAGDTLRELRDMARTARLALQTGTHIGAPVKEMMMSNLARVEQLAADPAASAAERASANVCFTTFYNMAKDQNLFTGRESGDLVKQVADQVQRMKAAGADTEVLENWMTQDSGAARNAASGARQLVRTIQPASSPLADSVRSGAKTVTDWWQENEAPVVEQTKAEVGGFVHDLASNPEAAEEVVAQAADENSSGKLGETGWMMGKALAASIIAIEALNWVEQASASHEANKLWSARHDPKKRDIFLHSHRNSLGDVMSRLESEDSRGGPHKFFARHDTFKMFLDGYFKSSVTPERLSDLHRRILAHEGLPDDPSKVKTPDEANRWNMIEALFHWDEPNEKVDWNGKQVAWARIGTEIAMEKERELKSPASSAKLATGGAPGRRPAARKHARKMSQSHVLAQAKNPVASVVVPACPRPLETSVINGQTACVFPKANVPSFVQPICGEVDSGQGDKTYFGYSWSLTPENYGFICPEGFDLLRMPSYSDRNPGTGYCMKMMAIPEHARQICSQGQLGFTSPAVAQSPTGTQNATGVAADGQVW